MKRWLLASVAIVILMAAALIFVVRAFIETPPPKVPVLADAPLALHINEIDLSTSGMILVSIDNLTQRDIDINAVALGNAISRSLRLFDPTGNEYQWVDSKGRIVLDAIASDQSWQWAWGGSTGDRTRIEAGRTENFALVVTPDLGLVASEWVARLRRTPPWLTYVIDCEIPTIDPQTGESKKIRTTATGETAYKPRP